MDTLPGVCIIGSPEHCGRSEGEREKMAVRKASQRPICVDYSWTSMTFIAAKVGRTFLGRKSNIYKCNFKIFCMFEIATLKFSIMIIVCWRIC